MESGGDLGEREELKEPLYIAGEKQSAEKTSMDKNKENAEINILIYLFLISLSFIFRGLETVEEKEQNHVGVPCSLLGRSVCIYDGGRLCNTV